jgi:hypothetical protein
MTEERKSTSRRVAVNNERIQCPFAGCGTIVAVEQMKAHLDIWPFGKFLNKVQYYDRLLLFCPLVCRCLLLHVY